MPQLSTLLSRIPWLHLVSTKTHASTIQTLSNQISSLTASLSEANRQLQDCRSHLLAANHERDHWQSLYIVSQEAHLQSLKSESNWFAISTSTRTPIHPGIGPARPVPVDDDASGQVPQVPKITRASQVARKETNEVLSKLDQLQAQFAEKLAGDIASIGTLTNEAPLDLLAEEAKVSKLYHDQWGVWPDWYAPKEHSDVPNPE